MRISAGKLILGVFGSLILMFFAFVLIAVALRETSTAFWYFSDGHIPFWFMYVLFGVFIAVTLGGVRTHSPAVVRATKKAFSFVWSFFIFYSPLALSWYVLRRAFDFSSYAETMGVLAICIISLTVIKAGYQHTKIIKTKEYQVNLRRQGSEYRIALISDLHMGIFVGHNHIRKVVSAVNALNPDLVVIAGDTFDADRALLTGYDKELNLISAELRKIKSGDGVFAVTGNHDPKLPNMKFRNFMKNSNVTLLDNEMTELPKINLIGRSDEATTKRTGLSEIMQGANSEKPVIVMDHRPAHVNEAAEENADLVLCGHTHRGQFFPMSVYTRVRNGKELHYGHSVTGNTHSIVTSGAGFFSVPLRLGSDNEIADIHLTV